MSINKLLFKLYDLSFKVESIIFNIPKSKEGESHEEFFERIVVDKGLRYLRHRIRKHSPVTPELLQKKKGQRSHKESIFY